MLSRVLAAIALSAALEPITPDVLQGELEAQMAKAGVPGAAR